MSYRHIDVHPLSGALGAEIRGVDLSKELPDAVRAEIRDAFHENLVIFFRDQDLTPEQHLAFARHFGTLHTNAFFPTADGYEQIQLVAKEPGDTKNIGDSWHSDVSYQAQPALGSVLYCHDCPPFGGDTLFANMYLAYEALSDGMKRTLRGLRAVNSAGERYRARNMNPEMQAGNKAMKFSFPEDAEQEAVHPVIRTHPETGRAALFVNGNHTVGFDGWSREESAPLLAYLFDHLGRPEFTCRFRWEAGSLAFWDNRCAQHYALNDYHGYRRIMHRVTVNGDRPA